MIQNKIEKLKLKLVYEHTSNKEQNKILSIDLEQKHLSTYDAFYNLLKDSCNLGQSSKIFLKNNLRTNTNNTIENEESLKVNQNNFKQIKERILSFEAENEINILVQDLKEQKEYNVHKEDNNVTVKKTEESIFNY